MKCKECGCEFDEGKFCPQCGTKYNGQEIENQKAQSILDDYKTVEAEKEKMKCKECGCEFDEGKFCPQCGTKYDGREIENQKGDSDDNSNTDSAYQKAQSILNEYKIVEAEKEKISAVGWSRESDVKERIKTNINNYKKIKQLGLKTEYAKQEIEKKRREIRNDYETIKNNETGVGVAIFWAIVFTIVSIKFLFSWGIIGIIIGIIVIIGAWGGVKDAKEEISFVDKLGAFL